MYGNALCLLLRRLRSRRGVRSACVPLLLAADMPVWLLICLSVSSAVCLALIMNSPLAVHPALKSIDGLRTKPSVLCDFFVV